MAGRKDIYKEFEKGRKNICTNKKANIGGRILGILFVIALFAVAIIVIRTTNNGLGKKEKKKYTMKNCYVIEAEKTIIKFFYDGEQKEMCLKSNIENKQADVIADIYVEDKKVTKLVIKPDSISGRVLSVTTESIEIEGYGSVKYAEGIAVYDNTKKEEKKSISDVAVGMNNLRFVAEKERICAILIDEIQTSVDKIRVLIKTDGFADIFHKNVVISSKDKLTLKYIDNNSSNNDSLEVLVPDVEERSDLLEKKEYVTKELAPEEKFEISLENHNNFNIGDRIIIESGQIGISVETLKRDYGEVTYGGNLEILLCDEGLILINELSIEDYLKKVLPSEMPESFGIEALKAQAICARTYAYKNMSDERYKQYGANVDDSTQYQVYNNKQSNSVADEAVAQTEGLVMKSDNMLIDSYYFSTSCGLTSTDKQVFGGDVENTYLTVKYQNVDGSIPADFSFENFIVNASTDCIENECPWFRWNTNISKKNISRKFSKIGDVDKVEVTKRLESGIAEEITIYGTKDNIKVNSQNKIRSVLAPVDSDVTKNDGSVSKGMSMLPSAYFIIENCEDSIKISGGGFGHGTGMSQYGAMVMSKNGKTYEEILQYYYKGISIEK